MPVDTHTQNYGLLFLLLMLLPASSALADEATTKEIKYLLSTIEHASACVFIRNNEHHSSDQARRHIQRKYYFYRNNITSAEQFVEFAASQSSITKLPYLMSCDDSLPPQPVAGWLLHNLSSYRAQKERANNKTND